MHAALIPEARARGAPDGRCLSGAGADLSNGEFAARVRAAAALLRASGVRRGDVVAAMMPGRVEFVVLLFAVWRLGATLTPINPALSEDECAFQLADSGAALGVADETCASRLRGHVATVLLPEELDGPDPGPGGAPVVADPRDLALLIYTSGTTGRPKGVMLGHDNVTAMAEIWIAWLEVTADDHCLLILPLFHVNGIMVSVVGPLMAGGSVTIAPRFQAEEFWDLVEATRPTYFSAVPTILAALAALPPEVHPDTSSLRFVGCGAAPASADLLHAFERRYNAPVIEGYGLSECTVAATINPLGGARKPGTVGLPLPRLRVDVVNRDGGPVERGTPGEVVIAGPTVMRGYLNSPRETAHVLRDGRLHSGDVGFYDEDGYLVISDRIKDLIIWGGENISPTQIEGVLVDHPAVLHAAVVGRPDERYGEEPVAFVSLLPGHSAAVSSLLRHCCERLARFKVPRDIWILDKLPTNAMGKIVKGPLRERVRQPTGE